MLPRFAFFLLFAPLGLLSQVQYNPYAGLFAGDQSTSFVLDADGFVGADGRRYAFGADFLVGRNNLAPAFGVLYRPNRFESEEYAGRNFHELFVPLGLAYRLLPAALTYNIVPSLMAVPRLRFDNPSGDALAWGARAGLTLYIDWVTVGTHFYYDISDSGPGVDYNRNQWLISLGGRF